MKYLVVSDLHGSVSGTMYLVKAAEREKPDVLLFLGDMYRGAYDASISKVVSSIKGLNLPILAVLGNCDYEEDSYLLNIDLPEARAIEFAHRTIHMMHRPPVFSFPPSDMVFYGHTHRKRLDSASGVIYLNPGSIALPRDDCPSYAVLDDFSIRLLNAEGGSLIKTLEL